MDKPPPLPKDQTPSNPQNSQPSAEESTSNLNQSDDNKYSKWMPFKGSDSLKLEREWRKYLTIIQNNAANLEKKHKKSAVLDNTINFEKVVVCGGMYEVDLLARECEPIYYKGDIVPIRRGVWFYENSKQPLRENIASAVEQEHVTRWCEENDDYNLTELQVQPNRDPLDDISAPDIFDDDRSNINQTQSKISTTSNRGQVVLHRAMLRQNLYEWTDSENIWESPPSKTWTGMITRLAKNPRTKLLRGYHEEAQPYDKFAPIKHVVFMVHGVGQFRDNRKIIRNTKFFESHIKKMLEKITVESKTLDPKTTGDRANKITGRVVFMPIEWRSRLKLDSGVLSSTTVDGIRKTRDKINDTVMDIFYYNSPFYKDEILNSAEESFKIVVDKFKQRNPEYDGDFSIFAHSLGSVICYDLLMGWHQEKWAEQAFKNLSNDRFKDEILDVVKMCRKSSRIGLKKIKFYISVASPLGMMRTMDGIKPPQTLDEDPFLILPENLVERHINIFHPSDPVAYRLEPLIHSLYQNVVPVKVHKSTVS